MGKTTKHIRKSGATTVKKDGKIVGNIGVGKNRTIVSPNSDLRSAPPPHTRKHVGSQTIMNAQQKMLLLSVEENEKEHSEKQPITLENAGTLWKLVENHQGEERCKVLNELAQQLSVGDAQKFEVEYLENDPEFTEELYETSAYPWHPKTLKMFSVHYSSEVRWLAAVHSETPPETLDYLAEDESFDVRMTVAQNEYTSVETLEKMANNDYEEDEIVCMTALDQLHHINNTKS